MGKQDLRTWIAEIEAAGELQHVTGADRDEEIGGIVDFYQRRTGNPAILFDDVPGYAKGHRVLANILTAVPRINLTLGMAADAPEMDLVHHWRGYMKDAKSIPPVDVKTGALLENVDEGNSINLFKIPVPKWHELDGGYYIGTGCMVIMQDPDSGWINYGAYRVQAHDAAVASIMCSKGKHGNLIMRKYHERGEPCPLVVVCGMHPALFMIAGLEIPYGKNEYDAAGGMLGESLLGLTAVLACTAGFASRGEWQKYYHSWDEANLLGAKIGAFIEGSTRFVSGLGLPQDLARTFIAVVVVSFALTTLDSATRLLRFNIEEIGQTLRIRAFGNRVLSSTVAAAAIAFFAFYEIDGSSAGLALWQLFGSTNQLLAGLALLVVALYLIERRRPSLPYLIPMVFMLVGTLTAMAIKLGDFYNQGQWLLLVVGSAITLTAIWLIVEAGLALGRYRRRSREVALDISLPKSE